jgi:hypothetical protein
MDFVDDIDFVVSFDWGVSHFLNEITDLVNAIIGSGVDLNDVWVIAVSDFLTVLAMVALMAKAFFAVEGFGEKSRHGGFASSTRAGEKISVGHLSGREGVLERAHNWFLASDLFESLRAVSEI